MKFSSYNLTATSAAGLIIYNTLTGALAVIEERNAQMVINAIAQDDPDLLGPSLHRGMANQQFAVPDDYDEKTLIKARALRGKTQNELIISIMLTLACMFNCGYCFQQRSKRRFGKNVEQATMAFLAKRVPKLERLSVDWYGGEPLMEFETLVRLNDWIKDLCEGNNTKYIVSVTTNGFLLTENVVEYLATQNVSHLQITLDGPPDTHNQSRPLKNGKPTFDTILTNICQAVDAKIPVIIRVNVWRENMSQIGELYDILEAHGLKNRVTVLVKAVLSSEANPCESQCLSSEEAAKISMSIYINAAAKGWVSLPFARALQSHQFCIVDSVGQFIIDPSGVLYKCGEQFNPDEGIGKIGSDGELLIDESRWLPWITKDPFGFPECVECKFLPICMGGCSMKRFWRPNTSPCLDIKHAGEDLLRAMVLSEANRGKEELP